MIHMVNFILNKINDLKNEQNEFIFNTRAKAGSRNAVERDEKVKILTMS